MKRYLFLSILLSSMAYAQTDAMPDSPLDSSMEEEEETTRVDQYTPNIEREQEQERQEELLENRYDVPDPKEEEEFNKNEAKQYYEY